MYTFWNENTGHFVGTALGEPVFSHQNHGEDFFRYFLRSVRLSGVEDELPVIVSRTQLETHSIRAGDRLRVEGAIRSYNNRTGVGNRLVLSVFTRVSEPTEEEDDNRVTLRGVLCRVPIYRHTPLGREICDLTLAVNRRYGRADYLPCICWGALARDCAAFRVGDCLSLQGRFQSRAYTKNQDGQLLSRTAYEVSVMSMERVLTEG